MVEAVFKERKKDGESIVRFLDKVCQVEFEKYIESSYQELSSYVNAYEQKMVMKRENIANKASGLLRKDIFLTYGIVRVSSMTNPN